MQPLHDRHSPTGRRGLPPIATARSSESWLHHLAAAAGHGRVPVALLARDHGARAHHAAVEPAARPAPDAPVGETAVVLRARTPPLPIAASRGGTEAGGSTRSENLTTLPGFILPSGSQIASTARPGRSDYFGPVHLFEELAASNARSPCSPESDPPYEEHELGGVVHEVTPLPQRRAGPSRYGCARNPAEVPVERAGVAVPVEQQPAGRGGKP